MIINILKIREIGKIRDLTKEVSVEIIPVSFKELIFAEKGYCSRDGCKYEHIDKVPISKKKVDAYDPLSPGMDIDKPQSYQPYIHGKSSRRPSGPFKLCKDTLVVEKIPVESCSLEKVDEYFKKFGKIVNVSLDKNQLKAVVKFERFSEAKAAHECPDSIFGNRFVKVFFLREYDENGVLVSNGLDTPIMHFKPPQQVFYEKGKQLIELQKNQEAIISSQIEASKVLMAQLASPNISATDKKIIVEQLRILQASTQSLVEKAAEHTRTLKLQTPTVKEDLERDRLDRELDLLNQIASASEENKESAPDQNSRRS